jgi:Spy/CpxP family protein refolding chaperone
MKTSIRSMLRPLSNIALAAGIASAVGLASPVAFAQDGPGAEQGQRPRGEGHRGMRHGGEGHRGMRHGRGGPGMGHGMRGMFEELNLSDAQRAQIQQIHEAARARFEAARSSGDRAAFRTIGRETHRQVEAVLTPAQRAQAEELRAQHAQRFLDRRLEHMTERLSLTARQQQQVRGVLSGAAQQRRALMEQAQLDESSPREAMQALRERTQAQLSSVLSAEQRAQLEAMRAQRGERGHGRGRHGQGRGGRPAGNGPAL